MIQILYRTSLYGNLQPKASAVQLLLPVMATITCKCGEVKVQFASAKPLWRLECCCYNCVAAINYSAKKAKTATLQHQCVDSWYFGNDFTITEGEDKIGKFDAIECAQCTPRLRMPLVTTTPS